METKSRPACPVRGCTGTVVSKLTGVGKLFGCDGPDLHGDATILGAFRAGDDLDRARTSAEMDAIERRLDPVAWVRDKLIEARRKPEEYVHTVDLDVTTELPKFPTGLTAFGHERLPHLQGMVTLTGKASSGKTWFGLGAGMNAADEGWDAHYVAGEGADVVARRVAAAERDREGFTLHTIEPGLTIEMLMDQITEWVIKPRTLLIFDSISTILGLMSISGGMSKWDNQSALEMFLMRIRSLTSGAVSIINLSEANAAGETKGRQLDHRSDIAINFASCEIDREVKTVTVTKTWEGRTGALGYGRVDWQAPGIAISDDPPLPPTPDPVYPGEQYENQW